MVWREWRRGEAGTASVCARPPMSLLCEFRYRRPESGHLADSARLGEALNHPIPTCYQRFVLECRLRAFASVQSLHALL
jgi:hypothetical protein